MLRGSASNGEGLRCSVEHSLTHLDIVLVHDTGTLANASADIARQ
jgi:hypothetical protein